MFMSATGANRRYHRVPKYCQKVASVPRDGDTLFYFQSPDIQKYNGEIRQFDALATGESDQNFKKKKI